MAMKVTVVAAVLAVLGFAGQSPAQPQAGDILFSSADIPGQSLLPRPVVLQPEPVPDPVLKAGPCDCRPSACCTPNWAVFADFLYLRPGNDKVAFGTPINGAIAPPSGVSPVQIAPEGVVDHDYQPAFRVGFRHAVDDGATVGAAYTQLDSTALGELHVASPDVIRSLVVHPGTLAAASDFLNASARSDIQFRLADVDYRRIVFCDELCAVDFLIGGRYVSMKQDFLSQFTNATTREDVGAQVDFEGGGIRVGLDAERRACGSGWMIYGHSAASFVGGVFHADYYQRDNFHGTVVNTGWREDRIISILDLELGVGWISSCGRFRFTGGYMINAWLNMLGTEDFIHAVQNNSSSRSTDLTNAMTFDGLVTRIEYRF